jgi:hypothetical protein
MILGTIGGFFFFVFHVGDRTRIVCNASGEMEMKQSQMVEEKTRNGEQSGDWLLRSPPLLVDQWVLQSGTEDTAMAPASTGCIVFLKEAPNKPCFCRKRPIMVKSSSFGAKMKTENEMRLRARRAPRQATLKNYVANFFETCQKISTDGGTEIYS